MTDRINLLDLNPDQLTQLVDQLGHPPYRARQIWRQLYQRGQLDPRAMTDLPASLRDDLAARATPPPEPLDLQTSADDSTTKALLPLHDGEMIETVLIRHHPHEHSSPRPRRTVCLSSQAGCAMGCVFCATGAQGYRRQLSVGEILLQAILARQWAQHDHAPDGDRADGLTHVVFMGMGEPLANYDAVSAALSRLSDPDGFALSPRRITVSTVGIPANMRRLAADHPQVNLAVSLHTPDPDQRRDLVPVPGASVDDIVDAARHHSDTTGRRVTFEYVLLAGVNDSRPHANRLADRLRGIRAQVNLIPLNPSPGIFGKRPPRRTVLGFQQTLQERGIPANVRVEKGRDIAAACGQLRGNRLRADQAQPNRERR